MASKGRVPVIGLVGGIGSGKSLVAEEFARHGGRVVSGDQLGHEALRQPAIRAQVLRRWGPKVVGPDGEIDRRQLGAIVFGDPAERQALESMVFGYIGKGLADQVAAARADPAVKLVVVDAAIMLEAGWNKNCDWLVYVHAPRPVRLARLAQQRGWSEKEVQAREAAQWPLTDKVARADFVIINRGEPRLVAEQVAALVRQIVDCQA
jgi:dephospho-CoA kinase